MIYNKKYVNDKIKQTSRKDNIMLISTKGRYALRVMIDLARHQNDEFIPLKEIAKRQGISEKYLESILKLLVINNIVTGTRGKKGGYKLMRRPSEYTAWDIISVTEKEFYAVSCLSPDAPVCSRANICPTLPMWKDFNQTLKDFFSKYTIADLADTPPF